MSENARNYCHYLENIFVCTIAMNIKLMLFPSKYRILSDYIRNIVLKFHKFRGPGALIECDRGAQSGNRWFKRVKLVIII